jgi:acetyltransferase-like isoleucine patch superfamily enzyme
MKLIDVMNRIFKGIYNRLLILINPVRYARSIGVKIGNNVHFYGLTPGMFGSEPWLITIGDNVHIVGGCNFVNHDGGVLILRKDFPNLEITKPIVIGSNVYIGINCTIMPGVNIGDNVIIGAGSVVTRDIPSGSVAVGVPARVIKSLDDYRAKVRSESLEVGHLGAKEKEAVLKKYFNITKRG